MAHAHCMLEEQGYMHVCAHTPPRARVPPCTHKHAHTDQYVILIGVFHSNSGFVNAPQSYVVRTLPVLLYFKLRSLCRVP
jgi:hypothetical protein